MTIPVNTARATKRWKLMTGTSEYQGHTSAVEYSDGSSGLVWKGGDDNTIADVQPGDPSIAITMAQDTDNPESLWSVLDAAEVGSKLPFIWWPHYDGTYATQTEITVLPMPLKTDRAGGVPEVTVTFPCTRRTPYTIP